MLKARPTDRPPVKKNASDTVKAKKKNSILAFQSYFESNGIKKETEKVIQHYIDKAQDGLNEFPEGKRENLNQFTTMILNRTY